MATIEMGLGRDDVELTVTKAELDRLEKAYQYFALFLQNLKLIPELRKGMWKIWPDLFDDDDLEVREQVLRNLIRTLKLDLQTCWFCANLIEADGEHSTFNDHVVCLTCADKLLEPSTATGKDER
jgi:hypothetical protein